MLDTQISEELGRLINGPMPNKPIGIIKKILYFSRAYGAVSFSYHVAPAFVMENNGLHRSYFTDRRALSKKINDTEFINLVKKAHDGIISNGAPSTYLSLVKHSEVNPTFREGLEDPRKTLERLLNMVANLGIVDEYIIPVYGPYKIEGCMCFGFQKPVKEVDELLLSELRKLALISHNMLVTYYQDRVAKIQLSAREIEVLHWLSLGKSKYDIAVISGLKPPTIETYTRRIYKKFKVNSKLGAVLAAIATNNLKL